MIAKRTLFELAKTLDGLPVLGCLAGSPAALAGVRYGDILLSVNGQRTRAFRRLPHHEAEGAPLRWDARRHLPALAKSTRWSSNTT